eukprot:12011-Heterococcus_DN1.PRE.2
MLATPAASTLSIQALHPAHYPNYRIAVCMCSLAELKRNILGAPFNKALTALQTGMSSNLPLMCVPWRRSEDVYIVPQADRVTVVYAVDFEELDERALCKVFLAEFPEAQRSANNAPPLNYTPEPPRELQGCKIRGKPVGYLSFAVALAEAVVGSATVTAGVGASASMLCIGEHHIAQPHVASKSANVEAVSALSLTAVAKPISALLSLHHHCKEYFVLNRAVPEVEDKAKKTAQGKTFTRG